jgi:hypothetical protein
MSVPDLTKVDKLVEMANGGRIEQHDDLVSPFFGGNERNMKIGNRKYVS